MTPNRKEAARNAGSERSVERQHAKQECWPVSASITRPGQLSRLDMLARRP